MISERKEGRRGGEDAFAAYLEALAADESCSAQKPSDQLGMPVSAGGLPSEADALRTVFPGRIKSSAGGHFPRHSIREPSQAFRYR